MNDEIAGKRAMMGVSLSNRQFSLPFIASIAELLTGAGASSLTIVLFEVCESINYQIFRGLSREDALARAIRRAREVRQGFLKHLRAAAFPAHVVTEEALCAEVMDAFMHALALLARAYELDESFRRDVQTQIYINLATKCEQRGERFVSENIDAMSRYVLRELAVFDSAFRSDLFDIELYPGEILFVKKRIWMGDYVSLKELALGKKQPGFINVGSLRKQDLTQAAAVNSLSQITGNSTPKGTADYVL